MEKSLSVILVLTALAGLFVVSLNALPVTEVLAWDTEGTRESLKEVKEVFPLVKVIQDRKLSEVVDSIGLQKHVEKKLRSAGVPLEIKIEHLEDQTTTVLSITLVWLKDTRIPFYLYCVDVGVLQHVSLKKKPHRDVLGCTWQETNLGLGKSANDAFNVVDDLVDKFIGAYNWAKGK